jgi:drug/metabolite transporter (DMT)-like permease
MERPPASRRALRYHRQVTDASALLPRLAPGSAVARSEGVGMLPMRSPPVPLRAVALLVCATLCFVTLDAMMKWLSRYYGVPFLVWARYGLQASMMAIWLLPGRGLGLVRTRHPWLQVLRGTLLTLSSLLFFFALLTLPLAEAVALNYLAPVVVVVLAALFLGERMTPPRWAMLAGCITGMLLIVRPGGAALGPGAAFALGAACTYGTFQVLTRRLAGEDPMVTLFYPALCGTVMLTVLLPLFWDAKPMPWQHLLAIVIAGVLGTVGHYLFILAYRAAAATGIAPFTYMQLVWAMVIGWLVFGNFPDLPALLGMAIIACSGILLAWHERARALRASNASVPRGGPSAPRPLPPQPPTLDRQIAMTRRSQ